LEIARRARLGAACCARIDLLFTMSDNARAAAQSRRYAQSSFSTNELGDAAPYVRSTNRGPAAKSGGARRDRTDDLLLAKQALSQLSYGPARRRPVGSPAEARGSWHGPPSPRLRRAAFAALRERRLVGLGRFELPTSRLSSARSNQLSYKPGSEDRGRTTENG
jgi:hypothetical protein